MSFNCSDFVDQLYPLLEGAGYSFHTSEPVDPLPAPGCIPEVKHWFCWTDGKCDVEVGPDCHDELEAQFEAVKHWFDNAKIPTITT